MSVERHPWSRLHYNDVTLGAIASQITSLTIVYSTIYSDANQRKHQSSALLAFARGIHRGPVNSQHKWPVTRKMSPFDDVIMFTSAMVFVGYTALSRWRFRTKYLYIFWQHISTYMGNLDMFQSLFHISGELNWNGLIVGVKYMPTSWEYNCNHNHQCRIFNRVIMLHIKTAHVI